MRFAKYSMVGLLVMLLGACGESNGPGARESTLPAPSITDTSTVTDPGGSEVDFTDITEGSSMRCAPSEDGDLPAPEVDFELLTDPAQLFPLAQFAVVGTVRSVGAPTTARVELPDSGDVLEFEYVQVVYSVSDAIVSARSPRPGEDLTVTMPVSSEAPGCGGLLPKPGDREVVFVRTADTASVVEGVPVVVGRVGISDGSINAWPPSVWVNGQPLEAFDGTSADDFVNLTRAATQISSATTAETEETAPESPVIDPNDPDSIVTFGSHAYGEGEYWPTRELQRTYVYPDGSVVLVLLGGVDSDNERPIQLYRSDINIDDLVDVVSRAEAAGLVGGGMQQMVPLPTGVQVVDGGQYVFTAKLNGRETARIVDQLDSNPAWDRSGERAAFAELYTAITAFSNETDSDTESFSRWAIVSAPVDQFEPDDDPSIWTGPDIDAIDWKPIGNGAKCAIIERSEWPFTRDERDEWRLVIDQRHITRRPLLPHEMTCADVEDWRSLVNP